MIMYFKDKKHKSKKRCKNYKNLNTVLESVDTIDNIGATSTSIKLSITGVGLIILPSSAGTACFLSVAIIILHKIIMNKFNKHKKTISKRSTNS